MIKVFFEKYKTAVLAAVGILCFLSFYFYFLGLSMKMNPNSDTVTAALLGNDIVSGNFLLKGWIGTTRNCIVETYVFYVLPIAILGAKIEVLQYVPPFVYSLLIVFAFGLVYKKGNKINYFGIFILMVLLGIPWNLYFADQILNPIIHTELFLFTLAFLFFINRLGMAEGKKKYIYAVLLFILSFAAITDPFSVFVFFTPMFIVFLIRLFDGEVKKKDFIFYGAFFTGTSAGYFSKNIIESLGGIYYDNPVKINFIAFDKFDDNIFMVLQGFLYNFQADFFGSSFAAAFPKIIEFIILFLIFLTVIYSVKNFRNMGITSQFLTISILTLTAAYCFATVLEPDILKGQLRYFSFINIAGTVLLAKTDMWKTFFSSKKQKIAIYGILIAVFAVHAFNNFQFNNYKNKLIPSDVSEAIAANNLQNGYALYWYAGINTFWLKEKGRKDYIVAPIIPPNFRMVWNSKESWYEEPVNYIIASTNDEKTYTDFFGTPEKRITIGGGGEQYILIWNYDISRFIGTPFKYNLWNENCSKCKRSKEGYTIFNGGAMHGGTYILPKGRHKVIISGSGLKGADVDALWITPEGPKPKHIEGLERYDDKVAFYVFSGGKKMRTEIRLFNNTGEDIKINGLSIQKE